MYKNVHFTGEIFKEGEAYVAYCPELDISSCGPDMNAARKNLLEATRLFMEESLKLGTLKEILEESGYNMDEEELNSPLIETDKLELKMEVGV
jgi:hypothetical protein